MNRIILLGRLTKDPELRKTKSDLPVASFSLAVDRRTKNENGERETDFFMARHGGARRQASHEGSSGLRLGDASDALVDG